MANATAGAESHATRAKVPRRTTAILQKSAWLTTHACAKGASLAFPSSLNLCILLALIILLVIEIILHH